MEKENHKEARKAVFIIFFAFMTTGCLFFGGCRFFSDYSNESLFSDDVSSVCLEMFDNQSFHRGVEYDLTDALSKRIESQAGYKIVSNKDRAESILSGQIVSVGKSSLGSERKTGRSIENEIRLTAIVNWKNLRTGRLLIDNQTVSAAANFSQWQNQGQEYGAAIAANKLAQKIVELMEKQW